MKLLCFDVCLNPKVYELSQDIWAKLISTEHTKIKSSWKEWEVIYKQNANFQLHVMLIVGTVERREHKISTNIL